ncbi:hypothetical protein COGO111638_05655 [Corynebacterium gottingense]
MVRAERRAARRHRGGHARRVHGHDVCVALHDHGLVPLRDVALGQVQAEQHLRLVVQERVLRVHVLAHRVVVEELASAEADGVAGGVLDRPDEAAAELVDGSAASHGGYAGVDKLLHLEAAPQQVLRQGVPAVGRVAALEAVDEVAVEAAVQQELAARLRLRLLEALAVELMRRLVRGQEALAGAGFDVARARGSALVVDVVADRVRDRLDGLGERELLQLHEEVEDVAALAGGKAVVVAARGADVEARRLLVLERAEALQRVVARRFELDVLADDVLDRRALADRLDVAFRNPAPCHAPNRSVRQCVA